VNYQIGQLNDLSNNSQNALFSHEQQPVINQIRKLASMYPDAKSAGALPWTGALGAKVASTLGSLGAAALGIHEFGHPELFASAALASPLLRSAMTSDWLKNAYIRSLSDNSGPSIKPAIRTSLLNSLLNSQGAQQ
jgi:hypothetical protein